MAGGVVLKRVEAVRIELARDDRLRQSTDVGSLLSCESGPLESRIVEARDPLRSHTRGDSVESCIGGSSRRQRDLLLEDDLYERGEAGWPIPQRWRAVTSDDGGEMAIAPSELSDAACEALGRQRGHHAYRTTRLGHV
jgi:hypothetical protein